MTESYTRNNFTARGLHRDIVCDIFYRMTRERHNKSTHTGRASFACPPVRCIFAPGSLSAVEETPAGGLLFRASAKTLGLKGTALLKDLERDPRVQQHGVGGAFTLKDEVTA